MVYPFIPVSNCICALKVGLGQQVILIGYHIQLKALEKEVLLTMQPLIFAKIFTKCCRKFMQFLMS